MFGAEVKPGTVTWIDASPERSIELTNACLLKRPNKRNARVVLEVCEPPEGNDPPLRVALAVLSTAGLENIKLQVLLTARMGLRIAGKGSEGAVVHLAGNEIFPQEDDFIMEDDDIDLHQELMGIMLGAGASDGSESDSETSEEGESDESDESDDDEQPEDINQAALKEKLRGDGKKRKPGKVEANGGGELVVRPKAGKPRSGGLPIMTHRSGLKFQDIIIGSGKRVVKGHNVALSYVLRLENGKVIDRADRKRPFKFRLGIGECVKGFDIGVVGMREGGERHLIVPPELGYGDQSPPGIPRNSTLYFDITVMKAF